MWFSSVSRRELMDVLVTGSVPRLTEGLLNELPKIKGDSISLVWQEMPSGKVDELPDWIVVKDGGLSEILSLLISIPHLPQPITAFCRVVEQSSAGRLNKKFITSSSSLLNGMAGLVMAEAAIYVGQGQLPVEVGHAAYRRTLSMALGRALAFAHPETHGLVPRNWVQTQMLLGVMPVGFSRISGTLARIFAAASAVISGGRPAEFVETIIFDIVTKGELGDKAWREVTGAWADAPSLTEFSQWTREQRSAGFQEMLKSCRFSNKLSGDDEVAACAVVASRIAPGTVEHLSMLAQFEDPRLPLWYGFFAGLQRHGAALRLGGGRGLRILTDMKLNSSSLAPDADISADELVLFSKIGLEKLSKRLAHSNEVIVELVPGVNASFRFGHRAERPVSGRAEDGSVEIARNRVFEAMRSLEKAFNELGGQDYSDAPQRQVKRRTKSGDLF